MQITFSMNDYDFIDPNPKAQRLKESSSGYIIHKLKQKHKEQTQAIDRVIAELEERKKKLSTGNSYLNFENGSWNAALTAAQEIVKEVLNTEPNNQNRGNTTQPERNA